MKNIKSFGGQLSTIHKVPAKVPAPKHIQQTLAKSFCKQRLYGKKNNRCHDMTNVVSNYIAV